MCVQAEARVEEQLTAEINRCISESVVPSLIAAASVKAGQQRLEQVGYGDDDRVDLVQESGAHVCLCVQAEKAKVQLLTSQIHELRTTSIITPAPLVVQLPSPKPLWQQMKMRRGEMEVVRRGRPTLATFLSQSEGVMSPLVQEPVRDYCGSMMTGGDPAVAHRLWGLGMVVCTGDDVSDGCEDLDRCADYQVEVLRSLRRARDSEPRGGEYRHGGLYAAPGHSACIMSGVLKLPPTGTDALMWCTWAGSNLSPSRG
jgi:hypothetical protein